MAEAQCGFNSIPGGAPARELLVAYGPTLIVDIGFDPDYNGQAPVALPVPGIKDIHALVDTGATESCIDSVLAAQLNLPIIDRRDVSGVHGKHQVNMHMAQVHVPSLNLTIYGVFAGVHLSSGGQAHNALIGRTFLRGCVMVYEGHTGVVTLRSV
jgi:predicted aspartyl protease